MPAPIKRLSAGTRFVSGTAVGGTSIGIVATNKDCFAYREVGTKTPALERWASGAAVD